MKEFNAHHSLWLPALRSGHIPLSENFALFSDELSLYSAATDEHKHPAKGSPDLLFWLTCLSSLKRCSNTQMERLRPFANVVQLNMFLVMLSPVLFGKNGDSH